MQDLFLKIISREIPAHIIWESETHIAFLDIKPIKPGHTLVVPKKKKDYMFDMPDQDYIDLLVAAKEVAIILKEKLGCKRVAMAVEGFAIPHVHIHLVPVNFGNELNPELAQDISQEELIEMKNKLTT